MKQKMKDTNRHFWKASAWKIQLSNNPELNGISANVDLLSKRFIVLDAENPACTLAVQALSEPIVRNDKVAGYLSRLVGFKGITVAESAESETSSLFFTVPLDEAYTRTPVTGSLIYGGACGTQKPEKEQTEKFLSTLKFLWVIIRFLWKRSGESAIVFSTTSISQPQRLIKLLSAVTMAKPLCSTEKQKQ
jgi:hypothetical protein